MFSSSSLQLIFISELPTSCQPATRFHRICEIREWEPRRKIIHASISNSMLHPHIMPEEKSRTARDNVCRQNREILRRSESSFLKRRFHNLRHEIFSHRFREGVRGVWTFPTSTFPPSPHPMWVLESMFFQGKDCVLLLKNTRSVKSFGHIIASFDK